MILIGTPGERPRLLCYTMAEAAPHLREGEITVEITELGDYVIEADGTVSPWMGDLDAQKMRLWATVKAARERHNALPITVADLGTFDAGEAARTALVAAVLAGVSANWTLADNTTADLTAAALAGVNAAIVARSNANQARSDALRAAIDAATTSAELTAIDITTGWSA